MSNESVTLKYDSIEAYTGKAVLFIFDTEEVWIPSSQIHNYNNLYFEGEQSGDVEVASWFVEKEYLDCYEV